MVETEAEHGEDSGRDEVVALLIGVCGSTRKEVTGSESVSERWT
jgi:hypothetical protein